MNQHSSSQPTEPEPAHPAEPLEGGGEWVLPTEMWGLIFEQLNVRHLRNVRLTCRAWNRIVDNTPALMDRFPVVHFRGETLPVFGARYRKASLERLTDIGQTATFRQFYIQWTSFGESLTKLEIVYCEIDFTQLLAILRVTTNLVDLEYYKAAGQSNRHSAVDFKLNKLEQLNLCNMDSYRMIDVFSSICPHLKSLKVHLAGDVLWSVDPEYDRSITTFVEKVHKTLHQLHIQVPSPALGDISTMKLLQLNRVTLFDEDCMSDFAEICEFIKAFPTLTYLDISSLAVKRSSMLSEIGTNLPNLRFFKVGVPDDSLEFLRTMPRLERLAIVNDSEDDLCFELDEFVSNLKHIAIAEMNIPLLNKHFPRLCSMKVKDTAVRVSDALKTITRLNSLESLYFDSIGFLPDTTSLSSTVSNIRILKISCRSFSWISGNYYYTELDDVFATLLRHCPALEELLLAARFDDDLILREFCKRLRRLRVLAIINPDLTESSLRYLVSHRDGMEDLRLLKLGPSEHFSVEAAQAILSGLDGVEVWYRYDYELEEDHAEDECK